MLLTLPIILKQNTYSLNLILTYIQLNLYYNIYILSIRGVYYETDKTNPNHDFTSHEHHDFNCIGVYRKHELKRISSRRLTPLISYERN